MTGEHSSEPVRRGVVSAFDEYVGLGVVTGEDGVDYPFHCVEIADGSRTIGVGTEVAFTPTPKLGRFEAFQLIC
jgi:CspA family cold shock protein